MLLPDIFTPISILSLLLILFTEPDSKKQNIILHIIFIIANATHFTHILINVSILISTLLSGYIKNFKSLIVPKKKILILIIISLSGLLAMLSSFSKAKHVFYMGRMVETGILKKFLDENCSNKNYQLCQYKDSLPPNADRFLWDYENSPLYKVGGWGNETKKEFTEIINKTFSEPKYLKLHLIAAIKNSFEQMNTFDIGEGNIAFDNESLLYKRIEMYANNDINMYTNSKQTKGNLILFNVLNPAINIIVYVSLLIIILFIVVKKLRITLHKFMLQTVLICILGIGYNNIFCASLSTIANRFGCRVIWLMPMCAILLIINFIYTKKESIK